MNRNEVHIGSRFGVFIRKRIETGTVVNIVGKGICTFRPDNSADVIEISIKKLRKVSQWDSVV